MTYNQIIFMAYISFLGFMTFVTMGLFFRDKGLAVKNQGPNRIKEKTLLAAIALGGAIGGALGSTLAHHKTDKSYFSFTIFVSLILQIAALVAIGYFAFFA